MLNDLTGFPVLREGTLRASPFLGVPELLARFGVRPAGPCRDAGIPVALLSDPEGVISIEQAGRLLASCVRHTGCVPFGLLLGESFSLDTLGPIGGLARGARDVGAALNGIVLEPRLKVLSRDGSNVLFDLSKMSWIGTPAQQPQVLWVWKDTPFHTAEDLKKAPSSFGATAPGGDNYILPTMTNALVGTQMKLVSGYKGVTDIFLAAEQGEVTGSTVNLSSLLGNPDWWNNKKARVLIQYGAERLPELKDVPTAIELASDAAGKQALKVYATKFRTTYPILLPPDVPADRVKALQKAFDETMKDTAFIADAQKIGIDVNPLSGEEIRGIMAEIDAAPDDVMERLRKLAN